MNAKIINYTIEYNSCPDQKEINELNKGLISYATEKANMPPIQGFSFLVRDEQKELIGGCIGSLYYGSLYIDTLYVKAFCRKQGIGKELMELAENFAHHHQCNFILLTTMSWEGLDFYRALGYEIEFERQGYINNAVLYVLRKNLK